MQLQDTKCVVVVNRALPVGLIANTAVILGISLGRLVPEMVGTPVADQDGNPHAGIVTFPVPILHGTPERLREIRTALHDASFQAVTAVDFTDLAQGCRTYDEYTEKMAACPEAALGYLAVGLCGPRKLVNRLSGNLPLLR